MESPCSTHDIVVGLKHWGWEALYESTGEVVRVGWQSRG